MTRLVASVACLLFSCGCTAAPPLSELNVVEVQAAARVLSVCEVFQSLPWYRGKMITVRGLLRDGIRQLDCPPHGWAAAHRVVPMLSLEGSDLDWESDPPLGFKTEPATWNKLERAEAELRPGQELWITASGRLRCAKDLPWAGYGHLGVYPAAFVLERVVDLEIRDNPAVDYTVKRYRGPA